jgi:hypothetical protein
VDGGATVKDSRLARRIEESPSALQDQKRRNKGPRPASIGMTGVNTFRNSCQDPVEPGTSRRPPERSGVRGRRIVVGMMLDECRLLP